MGKRRKVVSARKFVSDVRAGMSDAELMSAHQLDQKSLEKIRRLLVEKGLLDERRPEPEHVASPLPAPEESADEPDSSQHIAEHPEVDATKHDGPLSPCPQCGAPVGMKALICPECGHVLPGQERWERVEQKRPLTERIPPWLLGLVVSAPFAIVIFVMFQHFFIPATERRMDKGRQPVSAPAPSPAAPRVEGSKDETMIVGLSDLVQDLISRDIILAHSADYRTFTSGDGWNGLTVAERETILRTLQSRLREQKLTEEFFVIDAAGRPAARAVAGGVEILDAAASDGEAQPRENSPGDREEASPDE